MVITSLLPEEELLLLLLPLPSNVCGPSVTLALETWTTEVGHPPWPQPAGLDLEGAEGLSTRTCVAFQDRLF